MMSCNSIHYDRIEFGDLDKFREFVCRVSVFKARDI